MPGRTEEQKAKAAERAKRWRHANPEKVKSQKNHLYETNKEREQARAKAYRESHKEVIAARSKAKRLANPEETKAQRKRQCEAHKERDSAYAKVYRESHPEVATSARAWQQANPEKVRAGSRARRKANPKMHRQYDDTHRLKQRYGISPANRAEMLAACNGRCVICKTLFSKIYNERVNIDHCHKTGKVRGILCRQCNMMLGFAKDNPKLLQAGARYLERHNST